MTRQPARDVRARLHGAAEDIAALAGRGRVPDRSVPYLNWRDHGQCVCLALGLRVGESE